MAESPAGVLDKIIAVRRKRVEEARAHVPLARLAEAAAARRDYRDFWGAIAGPPLRVIAELKQASPSRGVLRQDYRPRVIAKGYEAAGAAALSVLTEEDFFQGSLNDLREVREATGLPVLRKDFIIDDYQVYESAAAGADALLLIVAALTGNELRRLIGLCATLSIAALVEAHTEEELLRAADAGARIIGVNNRNLKTLELDLETSLRLRPRIPAGCLGVSESGITSAADLRRLGDAGYDTVLIGEHFMTAEDPGKALAELLKLEWNLARPH
jgi:indole-3-glycerol phosphate synthase